MKNKESLYTMKIVESLFTCLNVKELSDVAGGNQSSVPQDDRSTLEKINASEE